MAETANTASKRQSITDQEALQFHSRGRPGKLEIVPTKPMATQRDLSLAYSPGVAVPVKAIATDPTKAYDYTSRGQQYTHHSLIKRCFDDSEQVLTFLELMELHFIKMFRSEGVSMPTIRKAAEAAGRRVGC